MTYKSVVRHIVLLKNSLLNEATQERFLEDLLKAKKKT